jgi:hypothetical protein
MHGDGKNQRSKFRVKKRTTGQSAWGWKGPEVKVLGIERTRGQSSGDRKDQRSKFWG